MESQKRMFISGYQELETACGGFRPGELTLLAARPAMGCTAFGLSLMVKKGGAGNILMLSLSATTVRLAYQLGFSSPEMAHDPIDRHLLHVSIHGRHHHVLHVELPELPLLLEALAHAAVQYDSDLIIVDGLSFIGGGHERLFGPRESHRGIVHTLKAMAVALRRPVLLMAHIHDDAHQERAVDYRQMALREPCADNIIVPHLYEEGSECLDDFGLAVRPGDCDFHVLKCRRHIHCSPFRLFQSGETGMFMDVHGLQFHM